MPRNLKPHRRPFLFALLLLACGGRAFAAETLIERSVESRFQIDLQVPEAALKTYLPPGWSSNVAQQGPAKDCNLRLIFTERITVNGPDGKPVGKGSGRTAALIAPVKDASGNNVQLVIGGITADASDVPGPFANYLAATTADTRRTTSSGVSGTTSETQDWTFEAKTGEHLQMHIKFQKGVGNRGPNPMDVRFVSAKDPSIVQISRQEQVLDILRNTTTNPPDRVEEFSLKISGGSYGPLLNGQPKVLSWDNILWISRSVLTP